MPWKKIVYSIPTMVGTLETEAYNETWDEEIAKQYAGNDLGKRDILSEEEWLELDANEIEIIEMREADDSTDTEGK